MKVFFKWVSMPVAILLVLTVAHIVIKTINGIFGGDGFEMYIDFIAGAVSNYLLESTFPIVYKIFIGLIVIFSLLLNISLREKHKLIRKIINSK